MREQAIRIEGTMNTLEQASLEVVKPRTIGVLTEKGKRGFSTKMSNDRFETFRALANAQGLSISGLATVLINKYIEEHVDEVLMLKNLRDKF